MNPSSSTQLDRGISPNSATGHSSDEKTPPVPGMMRTLRLSDALFLMRFLRTWHDKSAQSELERFCNINSVYS
ncbi:hypothetical protein CFB50_27000 [Burkholderia sp. AU33423]|nr:hypothetical protein CFB50_27000 [Burkholderia sp. AU33423]